MDRSQRELALFHAILDHSHDAIVITDSESKIRYWSHSASLLFGFSREEADEQVIAQLLIPERFQARAKERFDQFRNSRSALGFADVIEIEALQKSGKEISVALTLTSVVLDGKRWTIAIIRNDTARKQKEARLRKEATTDALSGLANRAEFQRQLEATWLEPASRAPIGLAILDLDDLKSINDRFGHLAGDAAIELVSAKLTQHFPEAICCARLGGDEFGLIISIDSDEGILEQLDRLRIDIERAPLGADSLVVTISAGVAFRKEADTARDLLGRADELLYEAKNAGRNRIAVATRI